MEMGAGDATGLPDITDDVTLLDHVSRFNIDLAHVCIEADDALAMIEIDHVAAEEEIAGIDHGTVSDRLDRCAFIGCDIQPAVWSALLFVEETSQSEDAADPAGHRPDEVDLRFCVCILLFCLLLTLALSNDTFSILFVGIDLAFVLDGEMLLIVLFIFYDHLAAYTEAISLLDGKFILSGICR